MSDVSTRHVVASFLFKETCSEFALLEFYISSKQQQQQQPLKGHSMKQLLLNRLFTGTIILINKHFDHQLCSAFLIINLTSARRTNDVIKSKMAALRIVLSVENLCVCWGGGGWGRFS